MSAERTVHALDKVADDELAEACRLYLERLAGYRNASAGTVCDYDANTAVYGLLEAIANLQVKARRLHIKRVSVV